jgi:hypothetical protein
MKLRDARAYRDPNGVAVPIEAFTPVIVPRPEPIHSQPRLFE